MISLYGNLVANPVKSTSKEGKPYFRLQVAENIRKKVEGDYVKDEKGHFVNEASYFHSVFVFDATICFEIQHLQKGAPIFLKGIAQFKTQKDKNGYEQYVLEKIRATHVNVNPFEKKESA